MATPRFKVGDRFISLYDSHPNITKGDCYEILEVIPPNRRGANYCGYSYSYAIPVRSFVIRNVNTFCSGWATQVVEEDLKDKKYLLKMG